MAAAGCEHHARVLLDVRSSAYCNVQREGLDVVGFVASYVIEVALILSSAYTSMVVSRRLAEKTVSQEDEGVSGPRSVVAASMLMLLGTIAHCVVRYSPLIAGTRGIIVVDMTMHLEAVISILSSNIPALVSWYAWVRSPKPRRSSWVSSALNVDMKPPAHVIVLGDLSASSREHDRKLGLSAGVAADEVSSLKSYLSLVSMG